MFGIGIHKVRSFFSNQEKGKILEDIQRAERKTSGEIKVHVESGSGKDPLLRAGEVFESLGMTRTALRNGVLIYLAVTEKKFAIIGGQGINAAVPDDFWEATKEKMKQYFQEGRFADGVCFGITSAGEHLATYFPRQSDDVNELSNDISEGN